MGTLSARPITALPLFECKRELSSLCDSYGGDLKLVWSHGRKRGAYLPAERKIILGPRVSNPRDSLYHQYAHAYTKGLCSESERHDLKFLEFLWELVVSRLGNPNQFSWWDEISGVYEFGKNRCRIWDGDNQECLHS